MRKSTVRDWILHYQERGLAELSIRNGSYRGIFKAEVIKHMLKNKASLLRTTILFGIPNTSVVWRWRQTYERFGTYIASTNNTKEQDAQYMFHE